MVKVKLIEQWRHVADYQHYEVSNLGRVRSNYANKQRILKAWLHNGYALVCLSKNGICKNPIVSILVCTAFHGPKPGPRYEAAHYDGDRQNNWCYNLRWTTHKDNCGDKSLHGTSYRGERHMNSKINEVKVVKIRELVDLGVSYNSIARELDTSYGVVQGVALRYTWNWV